MNEIMKPKTEQERDMELRNETGKALRETLTKKFGFKYLGDDVRYPQVETLVLDLVDPVLSLIHKSRGEE